MTNLLNTNGLYTLSAPDLSKPWVALVGPEIEENLSLRYLASSLAQAGFGAKIISFNAAVEIKNVLKGILGPERPPLMVAVSLSFQWRAMDFLGLSVVLRERGYKGHITGGGHFGTFQADDILTDFPEFDSLCLHESEETIAELAAAIQADKLLTNIKGLAFRTDDGKIFATAKRMPPELSTLPWPNRLGELESCLNQKVAMMISSRGCYANCNFCCISAWHKKAMYGKRFRERPIADVADEMAWLNKHKEITVFVFHDDNFFLPSPKKSLEKIRSLSAALDKRGVGRIGTIVKARPNDITAEICREMRDKLGVLRIYLGVETDSHQGLATLGRNVVSPQNHAAMDMLEALQIYASYNLLIFDPDTTIDGLQKNIAFMEKYAATPINFCRVELYAGTPLLSRMHNEGRCSGDYLGWDYTLHDINIQRIFKLSMKAFHKRNFADGSIVIKLMESRYEVELCRYFYPEYYSDEWFERTRAINRGLVFNSTGILREIIDYVVQGKDVKHDASFLNKLAVQMRVCEETCRIEANALQSEIRQALRKNCLVSDALPAYHN